MKILTTTAAGAAALAGGAFAQPNYAVFGDNIADPGNIPAILEAANANGEGPFDANFPADPPNFGNRFSNGLTAAEQLGGLLGFADAQIDNRAVGNAFSDKLPVSLAGNILLGSGSAIPAPIGRELTPLNDTDIRSQVTGYITDRGTLGSDDLMLLYPSANDGALALNTIALTSPDQATALQIVTSGAQTNAINTIGSAQALLNAGAGTVLIPNLPNIGQTPAAQAGDLAGQQLATLFSTTTNDALVTNAAAADLNNGTLIIADSFTLTNDIVANPAKYGFSDVTTPCSLAAACLSADQATQDTFLFWDAFFPMVAGHRVYAAFLADSVAAPKTVAALAERSRTVADGLTLDMLKSAVPNDEGWSFGGNVAFRKTERDTTAFAQGYDTDDIRFDLALTRRAPKNRWFSIGLSVLDGSTEFNGLNASFEQTTFLIGLAGQTHAGPVRLSGSAAIGFDQFEDITRVTGVADQTVRAETDGSSIALLAEAALPHQLDEKLTISPLVRLGFGSGEVDGFAETGATGLSQLVNDTKSERTFGAVGIEVARTFDNGGDAWVRATYETAFDNDGIDVRTALDSLSDFTRQATVDTFDEELFRVELGASMSPTDRWDLAIDGDIVLGADEFDDASLQLSARYKF